MTHLGSEHVSSAKTARTARFSPARIVAVAVAASLALGLTGCSTPISQVVGRGAEPICIGRG